MKVSIVTVCKNSEKSIEQTIKSVVGQTYKDIEYIIVDGDSQDRTKEILERYADRVTKIISEPDGGIYEAMNKGIELSTGSFINFLNSDDYFYDPDVVQDVVAFILGRPDCDFIYGDAHLRPHPQLSTESSFGKPPLPQNIAEAMILCDSLFLQGAVFFSTNIFLKLGLFDESYKISADYEFFTRLIQHQALKICYYPRTIFSYYQGGLSSDVKATLTEMFKIQNKSPVFQTEHWLKKRVCKFQEGVIDLQDLFRRTQKLSEERRVLIAAMETEMAAAQAEALAAKTEMATAQAEALAAQAEIAAMKTSKFWKLRTAWCRLKKAIR